MTQQENKTPAPNSVRVLARQNYQNFRRGLQSPAWSASFAQPIIGGTDFLESIEALFSQG